MQVSPHDFRKRQMTTCATMALSADLPWGGNSRLCMMSTQALTIQATSNSTSTRKEVSVPSTLFSLSPKNSDSRVSSRSKFFNISDRSFPGGIAWRAVSASPKPNVRNRPLPSFDDIMNKKLDKRRRDGRLLILGQSKCASPFPVILASRVFKCPRLSLYLKKKSQNFCK